MSHRNIVRTIVLMICVWAVFGVLSLWVQVGVLLAALAGVALLGGVFLGHLTVYVAPFTVLAILVRAEVVTKSPVKLAIFVPGVAVVIVVMAALAFGGTRVRIAVRRGASS